MINNYCPVGLYTEFVVFLQKLIKFVLLFFVGIECDFKLSGTILPESKAKQMESNYSRILDSLNCKLENK